MQKEFQDIKQKISSIDKLHWLLIVAVAVLGIWLLWLLSKPKQTFDDGFRKAQIESLQQQIAADSIAKNNLNKKVEVLNNNFDSLQHKLTKNETKIKTIRSIVAIKDSIIDSNDVSELQQFLSEQGKTAN